MDYWEFLKHENGLWFWRHTNAAGAVRRSATVFESECDCMGNAIYHGYQPPPASALRQRAACHL